MFSSNTTQVSSDATFIEDVFSTWLYTGDGSTSPGQTIVNGVDLAGKGGMVWRKSRSASGSHYLADTTRTAAAGQLSTNNTNALSFAGAFTFNANGFTAADVYGSGVTTASWTFREQPKFFDIVTYTGDGVAGRQIAHGLGSVPGCIIVKCTTDATNWAVYHRSIGATKFLLLNSTNAEATASDNWNNTEPTATHFTLGTSNGVNADPAVWGTRTYVAYVLAHDAGGFGLTGTDNVISCGSFTSTGAGAATITLNYEPQLIIAKRSDATSGWFMIDNMRGFPFSGASQFVQANTSTAENGTLDFTIRNTGFYYDGSSNATFIYIAIRRGPMRTPTTGTSVFVPVVATSGTATTNFPIDMQILSDKGSNNSILNQQFVDRLRGVSSTATQQGVYLLSPSTAAESSAFPSSSKQWSNTGFDIPLNYEGGSSLYLSFRRAPSVFDEVCYKGTGPNQVVTHNLGVVPELIIIKARTDTTAWNVYSSAVGSGKRLFLNTTDAVNNLDGYAALSSTTFTTGASAQVCGSGNNYVGYLFASCPAVSKVGSYTGTATTQAINCGFTAGSRFIMIKRTDSAGDWYVWDSARGIVSGNDPYLLLNSSAAEVTSTDWVDTIASGFELTNTAPAALNALGGNYIFLAIA
jgi:hypothetical protein